MDQSPLYQQIAEAIRQEILSGSLKPGTRLPPIRKMTKQWQCNPGTILRAYQELARLGLVISHVGQGTKVVDHLPDQVQTPLRRAALFNRTEAFLLESTKVLGQEIAIDRGEVGRQPTIIAARQCPEMLMSVNFHSMPRLRM